MPIDRSRPPPLGPDPAFVFPAIGKERREHGLRVWTVSHRAVPLTTLLLLIPVGAAADAPDRPGLAALTADLLDEGAGRRDAMELHEALGRIGGRLDTEVGADATTLTVTVLSRHVERALELLADLVLRPRLEPTEFDRVRERRSNRLLQLKDLPSVIADRAFLRLVYPAHPYGHLAVGTVEAIRSATLDELVAFHRRAYRLDRATLIIVTVRDPAALQKTAGDQLGIPTVGDPGEVVDAAHAPAPARPARHLALIHRAGAAQAELRIGQVATSGHSPDLHPLLVLNMALGGQFVSRLNLNLRERKGYTYGVRSSFDFRRGRGPFMVQTGVQTEATADAIAATLAEIRDIRDDRPVTGEEIETARHALTRGYPRSFETAGQVARACAQLALYELPDDFFSQFVPRVSAVGIEAVTDVARRYLEPQAMLTVIVGDRDKVQPTLDTAGLGVAVELEPEF